MGKLIRNIAIWFLLSFSLGCVVQKSAVEKKIVNIKPDLVLPVPVSEIPASEEPDAFEQHLENRFSQKLEQHQTRLNKIITKQTEILKKIDEDLKQFEKKEL